MILQEHWPNIIACITRSCIQSGTAWWRYQMETFSSFLALCAGNSPVTGELPPHKPVTRSFDLIYDWTNLWVNIKNAGDLRRHHAHCDVTVMDWLVYCWHSLKGRCPAMTIILHSITSYMLISKVDNEPICIEPNFIRICFVNGCKKLRVEWVETFS